MVRLSKITMLLFVTICVCFHHSYGQQPRLEPEPVSPFPDRRLRDRPVLPRARRDVYVNQYQTTSTEKKLLTPTTEDTETYAVLLRQPDTGLIKIFPAGRWRIVSVDQLGTGQRPGFINFASIYSFTKTKHGHALQGYVDPRLGWAELRLENGMFATGFTGSSLGLLVNLGNTNLETITHATSGASEIAEFKPPKDYTEEQRFVRICRTGFKLHGFVYRASLPALVNNTYILRSISNKRADLLVAFRVVREDEDGSLTLLWKKIRNNPKPSWKKKPD